MFKKYFITFLLIFSFLSIGLLAYARNLEEITDWYIKNFETNITVNKDSSLFITENITADCGNLQNKHGIFRVLPTEVKTDSGIYKTPIELVSITDFDNNPYHYQTIRDNYQNTVTWKIGDPNITVQGVNYYRIVYKVKNTIRFGNKDFDELYWNLMGNFWDIGTDNFSSKISFPNEINSQNTKIDYYTGLLGSKDKSLATYFWESNNILVFNSASSLQPREGITVSIIFPKNVFTPYVPTFIEKYGDYLWYLTFLIPLLFFIFAFSKWRKYGKDPKMKKPIPPEFGIPDNITPIQMGMVLFHGAFRNNFVTATIIDLAVRKFITIEQKDTKILFFKGKDIALTKNTENYNTDSLTEPEKILLNNLFREKITVNLSDLKYNFSGELDMIKKSAEKEVVNKGWIEAKSNKYLIIFIALGIFIIWFSFWGLIFSAKLSLSILISGLILIFFGIFMPKRTQQGVDLLFKIKGFELYMKQAENFRQQFYEKENIFDKFLPYAIIFGIAELWAKKIQLIYGEDYFKNYHPAWLIGSTSASFDLNSFTSQLNSITTSVSQNVGSSSGSGGSGGSGGGGGGGGGGGW